MNAEFVNYEEQKPSTIPPRSASPAAECPMEFRLLSQILLSE